MALLSNRRGGLGLLAIGPSGVRRAANERRASYMAAPRAPSVNASPGRPIMVDNPINGLFEGLGSVGKMLGEYGERKKAEAEKQKIEDAIKAAYAPMTEMKPVQRPEGLVYKGRGGVGDVTSGGPIAPPPGAKMGSTSQALQRREELDRSLALERKGGYGGLTYQPTRTEQVQTQRQRNAFERAQYFASKGLYDLAGKEMEMAKVEEARGNRTKDLELRRQIGERLANGDTKGAAALSLQLSDGGGAVIQPLLNSTLKKPEVHVDGPVVTIVHPDGRIERKINQDVADHEARLAASRSQKSPMSSTGVEKEVDDIEAISSALDIMGEADRFITLITDKKLDFGVLANIGDNIASATGMGGESSQNKEAYNRFIKRMINESLRLNNGVQTEGDAQRAIEEIQAGRSPEAVQAALIDLYNINRRAIEIRKARISARRSAYNAPEADGLPETPGKYVLGQIKTVR